MLIIEQIAHGNSSTTLSDNMVFGERYGSLTVSSQTSWEESPPEQGEGGSIFQNHENLTEPASKVMQKFGLTWENDVEDILTIKDTFQEFAKGQRPQSYRHRVAFKVKGYNPGQVRAAVERSLLKRPILRTILVGDPGATAVHAVLRPSHVVYDILIKQESFSHESEVQETLVDDFGERFEARMFKAIVADIGGKDTALIITLNHSVFDALFAYSWYSDLDMFIQKPDFVPAPTMPFKLFADIHQQYKNSSLALSDINFHIRRLRGISRFTEALWPLKRAPGWMIGNDEGSKDFIVRRKWPFLPGWIADRLPSAMSINGPTLTWTMNMIQIKPAETCGELLTRMGRDQEELSSRAHAPWYQVLNGLGDDEGPIAKEASMRQVFNWDVSLKHLDSSVNDYKTLSPMGRMDWPDCGFFWNCGYVEHGTLLLCRVMG
ncbi:hypothetical protein EYC80_001080 [Monilinia laxa]|nr:hypothetical protein EYC80_001080 [Monilinia laxa]